MRLRDLGLAVGALPPGAANAVTDVPGVRVGHAPGAAGGITALLPFGRAPRRYFFGLAAFARRNSSMSFFGSKSFTRL